MAHSKLYLGLDFGTSGARAVAINDAGEVLAGAKQMYGNKAAADWPAEWHRALRALLSELGREVCAGVAAAAFDGTSSTALLVNTADAGAVAAGGAHLAAPKLYNEAQAREVVERAKAMAPAKHTATAASSTLCKLLAWDADGVWQQAQARGGQPRLLHHADWLAALLHGRWAASDWNNCLKLGFDPAAEAFPGWLTSQPFAGLLPAEVNAPGAPVAPVTAQVAAATGLSEDCLICAGTTDSIAAFMAAGVRRPGEAVTSLGSTLAVKLLSGTRVNDAATGVYSHRLGDTWLVGGASNTGGAVLRHYFSNERIAALTPRLRPDVPTGLDYYPLLRPGERFPVADPALAPRLEPRPSDDALFLQGLLEGMTAVEARAYAVLAAMGATPLTQVYTAGGGARNAAWTQMRQRLLG
ncbi:hypothetical protein WJX81_006147 [Elliptochloris bilobata]|uniref:Carbohydrate kinase FGGY C-terminal domain-containing protein n=1 Tax=Elliptochloris bilobata TaxID=381761 RepID=A0AAW1RA85_9CHLO